MKLEVVTGKQKPKGRRETLEALLRDSDVFLNVQMGKEIPDLVWIEFHGALARVPSLKNEKNNWGGLNVRALAHLQAMDIKFREALKAQGLEFLSFGDAAVHVSLLAYGARDEDNTMSTIKDWLEPSDKVVGRKKKRFRGWGVGLIENDSQARGYPLPASDVSKGIKHTRIVIRPWEQVRQDAIQFTAACCLVGAA